MKKLAIVFIAAVLLPTMALAWLAVRSMRDQEIVINSQRALLHQRSADALASDLNLFMDDVRVFFGQMVSDLVEEKGIEQLSVEFDGVIRERWSQASLGCVVTDSGQFLSPQPKGNDFEAIEFLEDNRLFLSNKSKALVYQAPEIKSRQIVVTENRIEMPALSEKDGNAEGLAPQSSLSSFSRMGSKESQTRLKKTAPVQSKVEVAEEKLQVSQYRSVGRTAKTGTILEVAATPALQAASPLVESAVEESAMAADAISLPKRDDFKVKKPVKRNVFPAKNEQSVFNAGQERELVDQIQELGDNDNWSSLEINSGNLRELMGDSDEGALSRFLQDGLHILLWKRHPLAQDRVFWAELNLQAIREDLRELVGEAASSPEEAEVSLALLDSDGDVVAQTVSGFRTDWKRPFVASEVGEILPHWEVAAYLLDPDVVNRSAQGVRLTIWFIVPVLVGAVAVGAFLIFRAVNLEMVTARQKTDFVSNVSHELKTPLTSIRMFSELLSGGKTVAPEKTQEYSGIISREAARLTRLINNLLDFSRMDRNEQPYRFERVDIRALVAETVENYRMQIESDGCALQFEDLIAVAYPVMGDRDALSQVLLNLLSNAEKYGCQGGEIQVKLEKGENKGVRISVLDRGPGIDRKFVGKIFEKFYRVDDSLSSGIQGSGLGLTLARQIIEHHDGELSFHNRAGGGSEFRIWIPEANQSIG